MAPNTSKYKYQYSLRFRVTTCSLRGGWWLAVPALSTIDGREESFFFLVEVAANLVTEQAVAECISDDALIHLKSYKYSSVDKSPVSKYILGPWVRLTDCCSPHIRMTLRFAPYMSMPLRAIDSSQIME
jgi:hypothetical protein